MYMFARFLKFESTDIKSVFMAPGSISLLKLKPISGKLAEKYKAQLDSLVEEFETRFQDFKNLELLFNILSSPFTVEADSASEDIQLELLDLQANYDLKEKFKSVVNLLEFYRSLPEASFSHLKNFAAKLLITIWFHIHL